MSELPEDKRKKITVFVDEAVHRPARIKIAEMDSSFQAVLAELLSRWAAGAITLSTSADEQTRQDEPEWIRSVPAGQREAHRMLNRILTEGSADDAGWILGNLRNFVEAIGSREKATPRKRHGT